ncbi:MAG: RNA-binding protein [Balneolales bacterium]
MNIYVGNLPYNTDDEAITGLFSEYGVVESVKIVIDRATNRSRGFGFVEMNNDAEAKRAIEALNELDFDGRALVVNEARPKKEVAGGGGRNFNGSNNKKYYR